jgi:hypothetical protein
MAAQRCQDRPCDSTSSLKMSDRSHRSEPSWSALCQLMLKFVVHRCHVQLSHQFLGHITLEFVQRARKTSDVHLTQIRQDNFRGRGKESFTPCTGWHKTFDRSY